MDTTSLRPTKRILIILIACALQLSSALVFTVTNGNHCHTVAVH
jgi:hypothetical protein